MGQGISFEELDLLCRLRDNNGPISYKLVEKNYDRLYIKNPLRMLRDLARDTCFVKEIWVDGHHRNYQNFPYFELTKEAKQYFDNFK